MILDDVLKKLTQDRRMYDRYGFEVAAEFVNMYQQYSAEDAERSDTRKKEWDKVRRTHSALQKGSLGN